MAPLANPEVVLPDGAPDFAAPERIGLIAGEGDFPLLLAQGALSHGIELTVFCIHGLANEKLRPLAKAFYTLKLTEISKLIDLAARHGIRHMTMAGRIPHRILLQQLSFDPRVLKILGGLRNKKADTLLRAATDEIEREGIKVLDSTMFLKACMPEGGLLTPGAPPTEEVLRDIEFGYPIAKEIGRLDIGQTIAVKNQIVIAVEGIEGTDGLIERAGQLGGPGIVVIKVAKPRQDMRFDVPVVGLATIANLARAGAAALCLTGGKSLFFDRPEAISLAEANGISILAQSEREESAG